MQSVHYIFLLCIIGCIRAFTIIDPPSLSSIPFAPLLAQFSAPLNQTGFTGQVVYVPGGGCTAITQDVAGKMVVIDRGVCTFEQKGQNVVNAGGIAFIMANTFAGNQLMLGAPPLPIVCFALSQAQGAQLKGYIAQYNITAVIKQDPAPPAQREALMDLYDSTGGQSWTINTNWGNSTQEPCIDWYGVVCYPDGDIQSIDLTFNNLIGTMPASFVQFSQIQAITLSYNSLYGTLPEFIGNFTALLSLNLYGNEFNGTIPEFWHHMIYQELLQTLDLGENNLVGTMPDWMPYIYAVSYLDLSFNHFNGSISFSQYSTSLQYVYLQVNSFSGVFPDLTHAASLLTLDVSYNQFSGSVPKTLNSKMLSLGTLNLKGNSFSGSFPSNFSGLPVRLLDVSYNSFVGAFDGSNLPSQIQNLKAAGNNITSITNMATAYTLLSIDFSNNQINQIWDLVSPALPIPSATQIANGQCLLDIDLSYNRITSNPAIVGPINLQGWPSLISFNIRNNNLTQNFIAVTYNVDVALKFVDFTDNQLTGVINANLGNLPVLSQLSFTGNLLTAPAPGVLPVYFYPDYTTSTYFPEFNMNCPGILTATQAVVDVEPAYHWYHLCQCESGYRRVNRTTPALDNPATNQRYSLMQFQCTPCPPGLTCLGRENQFNFSIQAHYYPTPSFTNPQYLLPCPFCNPLGQPVFVCQQYHQGRLCAKCEPGTYSRTTGCQPCAPTGSLVFILSMVLVIIAALAFSMYAIIRQVICGVNLKKLNTWIGVKSDQLDKSVHEQSLASLTIGINYYQTVSALGQYYTLPLTVSQLLSTIRILTTLTGAGIGIECLSSNLLEYSQLYLALLLEPVVGIGAVFVVWVIGKLIVKIMGREPVLLKEWNITSLKLLLFLLNFLFFPISNVAINAFRCDTDPATGIRYNSAYPYARCDSISTAVKVVVLLAFSGSLIVLFTTLVLLYKRGIALREKRGRIAYYVENSFAFFFLHFKEKYLWFAILVLLRRFLISLLVSLLPIYSSYAFALNSLVLVVSCIVVMFVKPFRTRIDNLMEVTTTICCIFVYGLSLIMALPEMTYGALLAEAFYFIVNIVMILWCAYQFAKTNFPSLWKIFGLGKSGSGSSESGVEITADESQPSTPSHLMPRLREDSSEFSDSF